ncbi:MAG: hypothetical protein EDM82_07300 [Cyanobacteria bacterium CYA]|nr:MAG: hypothetical protein EDM82_07300 [Cyanobacteria bacterium CYA]
MADGAVSRCGAGALGSETWALRPRAGPGAGAGGFGLHAFFFGAVLDETRLPMQETAFVIACRDSMQGPEHPRYSARTQVSGELDGPGTGRLAGERAVGGGGKNTEAPA